jgi:hypothetical protein
MAQIQHFQEVHVNINNTATMAASSNFSTVFDCGGTTVCCIKFDSQMENKTITFYVSNQSLPKVGNTLYPFYDMSGTLISLNVPTIPAGAFAVIQIPPIIFAGVRFIQVVSSLVVPQNSIIEFYSRPV